MIKHGDANPSSSAAAATADHWSDDHISLTVEQPQNGFWTSITMLARVPLPPAEVFAILTDPNNRHIFRSVKVRWGQMLQSYMVSLGRGSFCARELMFSGRPYNTDLPPPPPPPPPPPASSLGRQ